ITTSSPSPTATVSASAASLAPSASATAASTAASTASTSPASVVPSPAAAPGRYASPIGYSLQLPAPWHKSSCSVLTQQSPDPMGEEFVPVAVRDENGPDIGDPYSTLRVFAESNPQNVSARQWAEQGKTIGGMAGERVEDV